MKQQLREEIAPLLLPTFLEISAAWRHCFPQQRSYLRALRRGLGGLVCLGRRTLARIIWTNGGEQRSGSGEYFLHSRCRWRPQQLFAPIWRKALPFCRRRLVGVRFTAGSAGRIAAGQTGGPSLPAALSPSSRPGGNDAVHASVGDRLSKMLADVPEHNQKDCPVGTVTS